MDEPDRRTVPATWPWWVLVATLLAVAWLLVHLAGGTRTALPHLFYVPVVAAAITLGARAAVVTGVLAALLCGPLMPLDTVEGIAQTPANWLTRGMFLVVVGVLTGIGVRTTVRRREAALAERLTAALLPRNEPDVIDLSGPDRDELTAELERDSYEIVFQPIVDLHDGRVRAYEALTRFPGRHASDRWFASAASYGLGVQLELATVRAALDAAACLPPDLALSLNASPCLLLDPRFEELLGDRLDERPLTIEVTEHAVVGDYDALVRALVGLRGLGLRIAVDDAGAGYASMQHVLRLQPDELKLDTSLTQGLRDDPVRHALAAALVGFAADAGILLVAEGIETEQDLDAWRALGADAAQGYLLGRPGPLPRAGADPRVPAGRADRGTA